MQDLLGISLHSGEPVLILVVGLAAVQLVFVEIALAAFVRRSAWPNELVLRVYPERAVCISEVYK